MAQKELRTPAQDRYLYADLLAMCSEELLYWRLMRVAYFNFLNCKIIFTEPKSSQHSLQRKQQQF